ncbi:uncharacterized protein LOC120884467 [Ictidomys tridecemlineatus]
MPKQSPEAFGARWRLGRLCGGPGTETQRVPFPHRGLGATGRCGRQPALFSYEGWGGGMGGGEHGGGGGGRSDSSGALGGRVLDPGGAVARIPHLPWREWERGPRERRVEPSARPRRGRGRGPAPEVRPFPSRLSLSPKPSVAGPHPPVPRAVALVPLASSFLPPAAGPPRPGAEQLSGGRNPAPRHRRSAPTQAGFSPGAQHPEMEGRGSEAAGRGGPAEEPRLPGGSPGGPAGSRLRARHARLGPCAAPAARAAPPFLPARRRRRSALRIPSSRRFPAPRAARASAHNGARPPPPSAGPRLQPWWPVGILRPGSGAAGDPSSPSSPKISLCPSLPGAWSRVQPAILWPDLGDFGRPPPPAWVPAPPVLAPLFCIPLYSPSPHSTQLQPRRCAPLLWPGSIGRFLSCQTRVQRAYWAILWPGDRAKEGRAGRGAPG